MKLNMLTNYDDTKIMQLAELYLKFHAKELQDTTSYKFRSQFKHLFPEAVSTVSSIPLTKDSINKMIEWQRTISNNMDLNH